jgi:hypothetical protein
MGEEIWRIFLAFVVATVTVGLIFYITAIEFFEALEAALKFLEP